MSQQDPPKTDPKGAADAHLLSIIVFVNVVILLLLLANTLPRFGITTTFIDPDDPKEFAKAVKSNTRLFFAESLGNPKLDVLDLKAIADEAKKAKVPFKMLISRFVFEGRCHQAV